MKIGMNLLLWTGHVTEEHVPVLKALKATGFDGVEVPVFDPSDVSHYRRLAGVLDDLGLQRTVVALIPDEAHSPISAVAAARAALEEADAMLVVGSSLEVYPVAGLPEETEPDDAVVGA